MDLDELIEDPETFMINRLPGSSHQVLHVDFRGTDYVVKRPYNSLGGALDMVLRGSSAFQDYCFIGGRKVLPPKSRLEREAKKLEQAGGQNMPRLVKYQRPILVRQHISGHGIHHFHSRGERENAVGRGIESLSSLHQLGIVVGDAHVKNMLIHKEGNEAYWLPSGVYDESDVVTASARDILKLIYSTYTATRDSELAYWTAETVAEKYPDDAVKSKATELLSRLNYGPGLWFSTRIRHRSVHGMIKTAFSLQ